jgi:hypothetical protein
MNKRNAMMTAVASATTVTLAFAFAPDHASRAQEAPTTTSTVPAATDPGVASASGTRELSELLLSAADLPGSGWSTAAPADAGSLGTKCGADHTQSDATTATAIFTRGQLDGVLWAEAEPIIVESLARYNGDAHQRFESLRHEFEACIRLLEENPDVDGAALLPLTIAGIGDEHWAVRVHLMNRSGDSELVMDVVLVRADAMVMQLVHFTAYGPVNAALTSLVAERAVARVHR